jgi:thiol-disulfide isomerase/thioredoxin
MAAAAVPSSHPWSTGKCVVLFTAPWCGHCQRLKGTWSAFTKAVDNQHPRVKVLVIDTDKYDTRSVKPDVFGFPTIRAYRDGQLVREFDADRNQTALLKFVRTTLGSGSASSKRRRASQTAGRRSSRKTTTRRHRRNRRQRGGGGVASCASAIGKPFDVPSKVAPGAQWSGPYDQAPASPYNGGLYTGPPASGPHAPIPVTPTAAKYIHENLRSASGTPQSTTQYPTAGTHRPGNSWSGMPGVYNYAKQGTGPHRIHCTGDAPAPAATNAVGGARRQRRRRSTRRGVGGGLQLRAPNMDDGAPFHPEWAAAAPSSGGTRKKAHARRRRRRGGLQLRAPNMDDGAPFHPEWAATAAGSH